MPAAIPIGRVFPSCRAIYPFHLLFAICAPLRVLRSKHKAVTSFVEHLNLTIRQDSAYLFRQTICQARWKQRLEDHLDLLRCHYNFARRHRGLKLESEIRTPAMQAGLARWRLTFREIFSWKMVFLATKNVLFALFETARPVRFPSGSLSGGLESILFI